MPNAADEQSLAESAKREKNQRSQELDDLQKILTMPEGRRVIWRFLEHTNAFASIWENSARIHYNAGRQDVGHFIIAEVEAAAQDALFVMMKEAKDRKKS
jgi:hypothetical protein